ncbi:Uncharacterised protein [Mycobacterium tuberculosis]|uniref:Uncharacterized protein n=1 Tax=Mycobacterium tuberculosis TaxID=1773 RepID=A0A655JN70_MYCTX|nr:Uncharacterised protein [Mycobacterium tuberculosis]
MAICARDSTWNTPTESARASISYTAGSERSRRARSTSMPLCSATRSFA